MYAIVGFTAHSLLQPPSHELKARRKAGFDFPVTACTLLQHAA